MSGGMALIGISNVVGAILIIKLHEAIVLYKKALDECNDRIAYKQQPNNGLLSRIKTYIRSS
jgi:hypothetical protein